MGDYTYSRFCKIRIVILFTSLFTFGVTQAAPTTFSYQGRITNASGGSPGFTMASFSFSIMVDKSHGNNPNCTIWREQADLIPVSADGLFDVAIGNGTANFPNSSSKVYEYMNNSGTVSCAEGGTFLLSASDKRFLDVQFNPNGTAGWNHIVPASEIRSVPYATNAISAEKLGGLVATDYVRKTDLSTCSTGQFLTYNGAAFACDTPAGGGSSLDASYTIKGLVQFLTNAATSGIVVTNGVAQVNTGTGANQIVKLDGTGKLPAIDGSQLTGIVASSATTATSATTAGSATNFTGSLTGDVSGTQSATSVDKVKGMSVVTTGAANGKVLKYSSGTLVFADDDTGSTVVDSSYSAKGIVQFNTNAATSGMSVVAGVATVNTGTAANQIVKLDGSAKLPAVDGSQLTGVVASSATTAGSATNFSGSLAGDVSGTQGATSVDKIKGAAVDTTGIATGKILKYDGTKWTMADDATGGTPSDSSYSAKGIVQFDTSAALSGITVAAGVAKVNTGTAANQIVQLDSSAKLPAVDGSALTNIVASSLSGILPINKGGTGQSTKQAGFDALSPLAAKGSIITHDGTNNVALAVGSTDGHVLMVDSAAANGIKWAAPTATDLTTVTGTGIVQRTGVGTYATLGTTAPINVTGSSIGLAYGTGLTTSAGSLVVDTGVTTGKIVAMDTGNKLPAVDGSQLTNVVAASATSATNFTGSLVGDVSGTQGATSVDKIKGSPVVTTGIADGKILKYQSGNWVMADDATGGSPVDASYSAKGIVQFDTSAALSGITIASGVAKVNVGTAANQIVQMDSSAKLPAVDGSQLTGVVAASAATATNFSGSLAGDVSGTQGATSVDKIKGATVDTTGIASGKILKYDGTKWTMADDATGTSPGDATTSAKGIMQVGSGLSVTAGLVSVDAANLAVNPANFSAVVPISKGGTGQSSKTAGFDALSPLTTAGDLVTSDGTNNVRIARGTAGQILSSTAGGLQWINAPTTVTNFSGSLVGDVSGTQGATSVDKIKGATVDTTGIASGKILKYDGTKWTMADDATGSAPGDASTSAKGIMQVGSGLSVTAGLVSVDAANLAVNPANFSAVVPISKGGTGQSSKTAGFDALSPLTTKGDIIYFDGTNNVRLAPGTAGQLLSADTTDGVKWINAPSAGVSSMSGTLPVVITGTTTPVVSVNAATTSAQGVVQVGAGIAVSTGTISADPANFPSAVPIAKGGTGAATKTAGFDALSPLAAKGSIVTHNGTNSVSLAVGSSDGQVLVVDAAAANGIKWASPTATDITTITGTGIVQRTGAGTYAALGTAAPLNVTGSDLGLSYGAGLTLSSGSLVVDTGTTTGKVVAVGASNKLPAIDGSLLTNIVASSLSGVLPIASGGTGASTKLGAFDALSPMSAKGDLIVFDGTNNVRLPASSTNGQVLTVDTTAAGGVKWAAASGGVTSVSGTLPIVITGTTTPTVSVNAATTSTAGVVTVGTGLAVSSGTISVDPTNFGSVVPVAKGGTGATTLTGAGILVNGGNSFGAAASVGTNDAFDFKIRAGNSDRIQVASANGNVSIGTGAAANDKLEVNGSIRGASYDNGTTTTIDWSRGNTQSVTTNCGSQLTFSNMRDGGVYTLAITASTTFSASCTFGQTSPDTLSGTAGSGNFYFLPANATASGANAVYSFMRVGTKVYVNWSSGYAN
ncbi:beta strand repeat-containing protein [Bdellovibrio sp. HCB185ZH]|uniref:beta strand repeat-containing protein n=1 Tax=Bdellovibrio sp. HCB185ZH TaxID=3394235 RepID=UPI0039A6FC75